MPHSVFKNIISGTECPIHIKPGCKFKLVSCLEIYKRKLINFDNEGTLGPWKDSLKLASKGPFLGVVHEGPGGSPSPSMVPITPKWYFNMFKMTR